MMLKQYADEPQPETSSTLTGASTSTSVPAAKSVPAAVPTCERIIKAEVCWF